VWWFELACAVAERLGSEIKGTDGGGVASYPLVPGACPLVEGGKQPGFGGFDGLARFRSADGQLCDYPALVSSVSGMCSFRSKGPGRLSSSARDPKGPRVSGRLLSLYPFPPVLY
jgi:hypothetical protein